MSMTADGNKKFWNDDHILKAYRECMIQRPGEGRGKLYDAVSTEPVIVESLGPKSSSGYVIRVK